MRICCVVFTIRLTSYFNFLTFHFSLFFPKDRWADQFPLSCFSLETVQWVSPISVRRSRSSFRPPPAIRGSVCGPLLLPSLPPHEARAGPVTEPRLQRPVVRSPAGIPSWSLNPLLEEAKSSDGLVATISPLGSPRCPTREVHAVVGTSWGPRYLRSIRLLLLLAHRCLLDADAASSQMQLPLALARGGQRPAWFSPPTTSRDAACLRGWKWRRMLDQKPHAAEAPRRCQNAKAPPYPPNQYPTQLQSSN